MRDVIQKTLELNEGHTAHLDAQKVTLTEQDRELVKILRESAAFQRMEENDRDRHLYRQVLTSITVEPVSVVEKLCNKIPGLIEAGVLDKDLNVSQNLTEGMGDVDSSNTQAQAHGMYGVGDGADKDEPSGDADKGVSQDGETGDASKTASKGYLDEMDDVADPEHNQPKGDDDKKGVGEALGSDPVKGATASLRKKRDAAAKKGDKKALAKYDKALSLMGEAEQVAAEAEVQKDAPSIDDPCCRAANDAKYKDGAKQNESQTESEDGQSGPVKDHKPKADDPGEPSAATSGEKGETPDADTPDYSQVKAEDPSGSELNKGPAQASCTESFSEIEEKILAMLESAGIPAGSDRWNELYRKGFSYAIAERAKMVAEEKNAS